MGRGMRRSASWYIADVVWWRLTSDEVWEVRGADRCVSVYQYSGWLDTAWKWWRRVGQVVS